MVDYSGVIVGQFQQAFKSLCRDSVENVIARMKIRADKKRVQKALLSKDYADIINLNLADKILLAIGENISVLERMGAIDVVPINNTTAPKRMAEDYWWVRGIEPDANQITEIAIKYINIKTKLQEYYGGLNG